MITKNYYKLVCFYFIAKRPGGGVWWMPFRAIMINQDQDNIIVLN
jgi:hypothetical protein